MNLQSKIKSSAASAEVKELAICSVQSCELALHQTGLCVRHYGRRRRKMLAARKDLPTCEIDGCTKNVFARKVCTMHYQRIKRYGDPLICKRFKRLCMVEGCDRKHSSKGYCSTHARRYNKYGSAHKTKNVCGLGSTFLERFWSRVNKTSDCWLWCKQPPKNGYPIVRYEGRYYSAHVVSWMLANKRKTSKFILHSCDTPRCVNPAHLREGDIYDNNQDMRDRNRHARGEQSGNAKLKEEQVKEIIALAKTGIFQYKIAKLYNVTKTTISKIVLKKTWKHVN